MGPLFVSFAAFYSFYINRKKIVTSSYGRPLIGQCLISVYKLPRHNYLQKYISSIKFLNPCYRVQVYLLYNERHYVDLGYVDSVVYHIFPWFYSSTVTYWYLHIIQLSDRCGNPHKFGGRYIPPEERDSIEYFSFYPIDVEKYIEYIPNSDLLQGDSLFYSIKHTIKWSNLVTSSMELSRHITLFSQILS